MPLIAKIIKNIIQIAITRTKYSSVILMCFYYILGLPYLLVFLSPSLHNNIKEAIMETQKAGVNKPSQIRMMGFSGTPRANSSIIGMDNSVEIAINPVGIHKIFLAE